MINSDEKLTKNAKKDGSGNVIFDDLPAAL